MDSPCSTEPTEKKGYKPRFVASDSHINHMRLTKKVTPILMRLTIKAFLALAGHSPFLAKK